MRRLSTFDFATEGGSQGANPNPNPNPNPNLNPKSLTLTLTKAPAPQHTPRAAGGPLEVERPRRHPRALRGAVGWTPMPEL
jgi:hypothetical protein